ncbi:unnamed protein product [Rotaria socialis]|uniref:BZIP domain-containing protein n=1 Tax=Rotaria socialis TaxID=392032 RepID=A0A820UG00_9BILA|nr:unnamed protein product [Rotaria socialis]CAF3487007.1 unnamed protein product [Rotaria socialis]CAF3576946.1 unnamed protein product [Rotaria socialis]CAF4106275.1 unnamed protein product [Rotaria socialis]CAF4413907.1 unnamed protein product [Rotaria socialis]
MLFEQYHPQDLLTPSVNNDGVPKLDSSLTSLDFYLLDDIDLYLNSVSSIKATNNDLINDSIHDISPHPEDFFFDIDFDNLNTFNEKSDAFAESVPIEEIDIEKWISQASFPSPPMDTNTSPSSNADDASSILSWIGDESPVNTDMIVPPSPSLSSTDSSSMPSTKKQKLTTTERKLRKKDQNKSAAEKYRIKKKSERHELLDRQSKLKDINLELKLELENLTYRVEQFKQLFANLSEINPSISI